MVDSPSYRMAERLAGGPLAPILRQRRQERKESLSQIARGLFADFGIDVTPQTIGNWCDTLDIRPTADKAAS